MSQYAVFIIGFMAQIMFSARLLLQWILSEKAKKVVSPAIFWKLSIIGSFMLFLYGWIRDDFAIILGQFISYYIYIWNLNIQNKWKSINPLIRSILFITPILTIVYMCYNWEYNIQRLFYHEDIPMWLIVYGSLGQIIFTFRFIYQWLYSQKRQDSILPLGFWIISLIGSSIIITYALLRHDPVLILGQATGVFVYSRNIVILRKSLR